MSYTDWYNFLRKDEREWRHMINERRNDMESIYSNKIKPKLDKIDKAKKEILDPVGKKKEQREQELLKRKKILEELQNRAQVMREHLKKVMRGQALLQRRLKALGQLNKRTVLFQKAVVGHKRKEYNNTINQVNQNYGQYKQLYDEYQKIVEQYKQAIEKYNQKLKEVGYDDLQKAIKEYNSIRDWIKHKAIPKLKHIYEIMKEIAPKVAKEKEMELEKLSNLNNKYVCIDGKYYKFSFDGKNTKLEYIPNPNKIVAIKLDKIQYPRSVNEGAWNNVVDYIKGLSKKIDVGKIQNLNSVNVPKVNSPKVLKELEKYRVESLKNNQPIYHQQTGTLFVNGQGYSVAPSKVQQMSRDILNQQFLQRQQKKTPSEVYSDLYKLLF
jgi:uncharacterized protein YukE